MAATFDEVKDALNHPEVYLIDVRRKDEIASTGSIPASLNIPCKFAFRLFPLFLCLICSSIHYPKDILRFIVFTYLLISACFRSCA